MRRGWGSVGLPLPSVEIEIRDEDEEGRVLGPDEPGEICVRGPQVSGQYLERKAADDEGWFRPAKSVSWTATGYLFLSGRADGLIVRGGENFSSAKVEHVLLTHQSLALAAVVAIPSKSGARS